MENCGFELLGLSFGLELLAFFVSGDFSAYGFGLSRAHNSALCGPLLENFDESVFNIDIGQIMLDSAGIIDDIA